MSRREPSLLESTQNRASHSTEEQLIHAAVAAQIGLFRWNIKSGEVYWTDQTSRLLGLPITKSRRPIAHQHSYQEWARRVHPEDLPKLEQLIKRCIAKHLAFEEEYRVVWPNGEVRWLHGRGLFRYDKSGKPAWMFGVDMDVTERVRAEEALRESESRYRTLFEQSADGIAVVDRTGRMIMVNSRLARQFGYKRPELVGRSVEMLIPERLRDRHVSLRGAFHSHPHERPMHAVSGLLGRQKGGREFPIEISLGPMTVGKNDLVTAIVRDVSEREQMHMHLQALAATLEQRVEERTTELTKVHAEFRKTLDSIGDGFLACDEQWRVIYMNRAALKILDFRIDDVAGKTFWELFPKTIGTRLELEYRAAAAGEVREFENLYEPWNRWFYNRCYPREGGGASIYFTEITERKRAEQQLQQSQERLRAILDSAPVGILSLDENGIIESVNPAALQLFGHEENDMLGQRISQYTAMPSQGPEEDFLPHLLGAEGKPLLGLRREALGRCNDGRMIALEVTLAEFVLSDQKKYVVMMRDITQSKRLERELLESSERERQRLGRELHDGLGQHLHALYYRLTLLHKDLRDDRSPRAKEAAKLSKLLHEGIDLVRGLARGLQPVHSVPEGLMTSLGDLAARTAELYNIDCRFESTAPVFVEDHSAATHLYRIAQEAVNNAMKHGRPNRIQIKLGATEDAIVLGIKDNGVGIRRKAEQGRGIGLHIMQYRANAIHGSLVVQRSRKRGTEVVCSVRKSALQVQNNGKAMEK